MIIRDENNNQDIILTFHDWEKPQLEIYPMGEDISIEYFNERIKPELVNEKISQSGIAELKAIIKKLSKSLSEMEVKYYLQENNNPVLILKKHEDLPF